MKIAVVSDTAYPTPMEGGHGLGRAVHNIASGLLERGHEVSLYAAEGSRFAGRLVMPCAPRQDGERFLVKAVYEDHKRAPFDVIYEHTHQHDLPQLFGALPIVAHYHDRWQPPTRCMVLCSEGQRALMREHYADEVNGARVIHNAIPASTIQQSYRADEPPYVLYLGVMREYKQPLLAIEAAARGRFKLIIAGHQPHGTTNALFSGNESVKWAGVVSYARALELMRGAAVYLQAGWQEACPMTNIEAGLCGTPTAAWAAGGNLDYIANGTNGYLINPNAADLLDEVVDAVEKARKLDRREVRNYSEPHWGSVERQINEVEKALEDCAGGAWW